MDRLGREIFNRIGVPDILIEGANRFYKRHRVKLNSEFGRWRSFMTLADCKKMGSEGRTYCVITGRNEEAATALRYLYRTNIAKF